MRERTADEVNWGGFCRTWEVGWKKKLQQPAAEEKVDVVADWKGDFVGWRTRGRAVEMWRVRKTEMDVLLRERDGGRGLASLTNCTFLAYLSFSSEPFPTSWRVHSFLLTPYHSSTLLIFFTPPWDVGPSYSVHPSHPHFWHKSAPSTIP